MFSYKVLVAAFLVSTFSVIASAGTAFEVVVKGFGEFTVSREGAEKSSYQIRYPSAGPHKGGVQADEDRYIDYATRIQLIRMGKKDKLPKKTFYNDCFVWIKGDGIKDTIEYSHLPYFHSGYGLYPHKDVLKFMPEWRKMYATGRDRAYTFRFLPDPEEDRTLIFLDGSLVGKLPGVNPVTDVRVGSKSKLMTIVKKGNVEVLTKQGMYSLPTLDPARPHPLLANGAKLSIGSGVKKFGKVLIDVWAPENSVDQSKVRQTTVHRNLTWDPLFSRTRYKTGPEYMHWVVPCKSWLYAWVVCADIPMKGREPILGTQLAKLGAGCTHGNINVSKLRLDKPAPNKKQIGELEYTDESGKRVKTPLYIVRLKLEPNKLGSRFMNKFSLDFDFVGDGGRKWNKDTSVQIFGATLQEAPFSFKVKNPVRGNIFEQGKDEQKCAVEIVAETDEVEGIFEIEITDPYFKTLKKGSKKFSLAKNGDKLNIPVNLKGFGIGWYGLFYKFKDETGREIAQHEAAFTVLAPDDREAGYESPYACWPLLNGYHGSNPNPIEQLDIMRKAGYRKTWGQALHVKSEEEGKPWKVTVSSIYQQLPYNPGFPTKTYDELVRKFDRGVVKARETFEKFPHCEVIQLLHEQGGKDLAREVAGDRPAVRGEYRGWDFDNPDNFHKSQAARERWEAFFCTEFCKRMRKEFPNKRIMIGNGSSSSQKIACLLRNGFDLNLVDQLGIESKGFTTMPELNANREAPGMFWALRETARVFGYSNVTVNACNEFVFRPERTVQRSWSRDKIMQITDFSVRDYLICLIWGCDIISTGHLEDANDAYYDTNWGAGGQCKFYPFSYPKRMFTALAVLTRVLDCPKFLRMVDSGENCSYIAEFRRNRKTPDFAYALWTPQFGATAKVKFPSSAKIKVYDIWGHESALAENCEIDIGSSPCYIVSSEKMESAKIVRHFQQGLAGRKYEKVFECTTKNSFVSNGTRPANLGVASEAPMFRGKFDIFMEKDPQVGEALVAKLDKTVIDTRYGNVGGGSDGFGPGTGGSGGGAGGPGLYGQTKGKAEGPRPGGPGRECSITGESLVYAKGGHGGDCQGRSNRTSANGEDGRDGFGDGGGAGHSMKGNGGKGGDGVIVIKADGKVHKFAPGDKIRVAVHRAGVCEFLVVAGGGGGGSAAPNYGAGGGGAGGMDYRRVRVNGGEVFTGSVGRGGKGGVSGKSKSTNGEDSVLLCNGREVSHMIGGGGEGQLGGSGGGLFANKHSPALGGVIPDIAWEYGGVEFKKSVPFITYKPNTRIAVRLYGNSSFSKLSITFEDEKGKTYASGFDTYRGYQCFHGWHTLEANIPKELRAEGKKFKVKGVWFGATRKQINPKEMTEINDNFKLKDVYVVTVPETEAPPSDEAKHAAAVMKTVDEKDL